jgi:hypothetical protein
MSTRTDPSWYRQEAERLCQRAAMIINDDHLRDSYLGLAREYERLADPAKDKEFDEFHPARMV